MMCVILESEDTTKFTACDHFFLFSMTLLIRDKSQSQSQRKVKRFILKVSKSKSKMISKSKR